MSLILPSAAAGFAVVGAEVQGLAVVGAAVTGLAVVGFAVVSGAVDGAELFSSVGHGVSSATTGCTVLVIGGTPLFTGDSVAK
jgi:hypothetical protein